MNSFIRTPSGLSLVINNKPYTVDSSHVNYSFIINALREKRWGDIPDLINISRAVDKYVKETTGDATELEVDAEGGVVLFRGEPLRGVIVRRILDMAADMFDVTPMALFLARLYNNPSNKAIEQLYGWIEANGITITEDGFLIAFKRVRNDYKSFFDGTTDNSVGTTPELPRNKVDDRSEMTCSHGLHFCSQAYLPHYQGGQGRVLLLKIDPADVVSIPTDYNNAKGRACKYLILDELKGDARVGIETHNVIPQPVLTEQTNYNESDAYKAGYRAGYKDGRGKQAHGKSINYIPWRHADAEIEVRQHNEYDDGYEAGRKDGRNKHPNLFADDATRAESPKTWVSAPADVQDNAFLRARTVVAEQLGIMEPHTIVGSTKFSSDLGCDSLDEIELVMAIEDEFHIEIADEEAENCLTFGQAVDLIRSKLKNR